MIEGADKSLMARSRRLAILALTLFGLAAQVPAAHAADELRKAISMSGPQSLREDSHPNDYRLWGTREYFKGSSTKWVKLWVSWADLQAAAQKSRDASWSQLNTTAGLRRLDRQIRAANDDGVGVIVTVYQAFPTWANGATGSDPYSTKPAAQKLPTDLSTNGPWAWFISHLSARYNGSYNATGPHKPGKRETTAAWYGNPDRARADALEVVNEPNLLYWPVQDLHVKTATMIRTAEALSYAWGRQAILAPATSDHPDPGAARANVSVDWEAFTSAVLGALADFRPRVPVYWSHHNYKDVKYEDPAATSRVRRVVDMLHAQAWKGPTADRQVWLTEGGLNLGSAWADPIQRDAQAAKIAKSFGEMRSIPEIFMWTQHGMNDWAYNSFKSGLRDDFDFGLPGPGAARPAWSTWSGLPGSATP